MCGIVGIASLTPATDRTWLAGGRDSMTHRGPDHAGEWWSYNGQVGLAHRRLSIIDLSPAGHQPMLDDQHGKAIVFNGEIYNFRELRAELEQRGYCFRSATDTEVMLAAYDAWGTDCLSRLNGTFAFALYDNRRQKLFLARDRAGEKPLFYHLAEGKLYFASELKALLANPSLPRSINTEALDCYLAMGYVPGDSCMLLGFNKLPPANALMFDLQTGTAKVWRYWQLPELSIPAKSGRVDEVALLDEMESLLEDAVRLQLVADVPVGVLLSGGVDSSLVTAMAVRGSSQVQTFTIGFPGYKAIDESKHARLIARHFGTCHTELMAESASVDLLTRLAHQFDEPMVDSSMIPTFLVSQLVRKQCTVALWGDGGDELFGGYVHYSRLLWMQRRVGHVPLLLRCAISKGAEKLLPVGVKGRNWLQGLSVDLDNDVPLIASCFDAATRRKLMKQKTSWATVAEAAFKSRMPLNLDLLQRATRMDFNSYLAEDILVKIDRASMLNSLELRAPFLDYRLIEFAYGRVPSHLKATAYEKKILLKRLANRLLPKEFDLQRKQGFSIPIGQWLKAGPFRALIHAVLLDERCLFDRDTVLALLKGQDQGRNNGERLFALVLFELWRQDYGITI
jgi:asparagine synthase (glutamine-hydrolysing)